MTSNPCRIEANKRKSMVRNGVMCSIPWSKSEQSICLDTTAHYQANSLDQFFPEILTI